MVGEADKDCKMREIPNIESREQAHRLLSELFFRAQARISGMGSTGGAFCLLVVEVRCRMVSVYFILYSKCYICRYRTSKFSVHVCEDVIFISNDHRIVNSTYIASAR